MALPAGDRARLADRLWESLAEHHPMRVAMTPELEHLLGEESGNLDKAPTTDELRRRYKKVGLHSPNGPRRISANSS